MADFKDHFSIQSKTYSKYRPEYPKEFYSFLARNCDAHLVAWDCATGNGQAARGLSEYFNDVHATDASEAQIKNARGPDNIIYRVADAFESGLDDNSADLITVAQALHWFDLEKFIAEVERVLKLRGLIAVWSYAGMDIDDEINPVIQHYYNNVVGGYWPKERSYVEEGYANFDFPFTKLKAPSFTMATDWTVDQLIGYLNSWSATTRYKNDKKHDPLISIRNELNSIWDNNDAKKIKWPMTVLVGRKGKNKYAPKD